MAASVVTVGIPWGSDTTEPLPANHAGNRSTPLMVVGSEPRGNGRWGHADLSGSLWEWNLDWHKDDYYTDTEEGCVHCANLATARHRVMRGGYWENTVNQLRSACRGSYGPSSNYHPIGLRCARTP